MCAQKRVGVIGSGFKVPHKVRYNDDPIFDYLHQNQPPGSDLFKGYDKRHILDDNETLSSLMVSAAKLALIDSGTDVAEIDVLIGIASPSVYITPNELAVVHRDLKLRADCWTVPVSDDFTNAVTSLLLAHSLVESGHARKVLVCCGCAWSRCSNYLEPQAISSGDAAGAAVVARTAHSSSFCLRDAETHVDTDLYGGMYLSGMPLCSENGTPLKDPLTRPAYLMGPHDQHQLHSPPWYEISTEGRKMFKGPGVKAPPLLVKTLLDRNDISSADITLLTHQASSVLLDIWREKIQPGEHFDTLASYANMTVASLLVNMAVFKKQISKDYLVILGVGPMFQVSALLFERAESSV